MKFDSHDVHTFDVVAPVTLEYVPALHFVQTLELVAPVTFEYVPGGQGVQYSILLTFPYVPVTHVQRDTSVAATMLVVE